MKAMPDPDVFEFLDYREYLKAFYEARRLHSPIFSYRYLASRIGVDPAYLVKVIQGKKHLAVDCFPAACALCGLEGPRAEYLLELAKFAKARTDSAARSSFDLLMDLRGRGIRVMDEAQWEVFRDWRHQALRSLLGLVNVGDEWGRLGAMLDPPQEARAVRTSVLLLERHGLVEKVEGIWKVRERFVSSGRKGSRDLVHAFQRQTMELAARSLAAHGPESRDVSTVTVSLNRERFAVLSERIREFRQEILRLAQFETDADAVYQLNVQLFPMAFVEARS